MTAFFYHANGYSTSELISSFLEVADFLVTFTSAACDRGKGNDRMNEMKKKRSLLNF